eukprot:3110942-Pyramimonas_sp.AAC.1
MEFWELEEHEVAYSWFRTLKMWPGNGVLGTRRARSGLQLALDIENVAREEEHEVAYSWLRAFKMWPGNTVLGTRRARSGLQLAPDIENVAREW